MVFTAWNGNDHQGLLLLTWFDFNPSMENNFIPHFTGACNYLSMLGLNLNHISTRGNWEKSINEALVAPIYRLESTPDPLKRLDNWHFPIARTTDTNYIPGSRSNNLGGSSTAFYTENHSRFIGVNSGPLSWSHGLALFPVLVCSHMHENQKRCAK